MIAKVFQKIDTVAVDGSFSNLGKWVLSWSRKMQKAQTGQVQHYAMFMLAGVIAVIIIAMVLP